MVDALQKHFVVGDTVTWTSQSSGVAKTKQGVIIALVPQHARASHITSRLAEQTGKTLFDLYDLSSLDGSGAARNHDSYLIAVPQVSRRGTKKQKLYWPKVTGLRKVGP